MGEEKSGEIDLWDSGCFLVCMRKLPGGSRKGEEMKYPWIDAYLMGKRGVTKDLQADWNWVRYKLGDKLFAAVCLDGKNEPYYITIKLDPAEGEFLRSQYEDIVPGYYMNKAHWNSIKPDGAVPEDLLKDLLDKSYKIVLGAFSKKKQREILDLSCCGTDCGKCGLHGNLCKGCNEAAGKVFHMQDGKACPIYTCSVGKNKFATCAKCGQMPCGVWRSVKDPSMTQEEFEENIRERVENLG